LRSNLQLHADAYLFVVGLHGVEARVLVEHHHARVEVFDDVVEVELGGFLAVVAVDEGEGS